MCRPRGTWTRAPTVCCADARTILFDARTAMEYGMMGPVHRRLLADPRVRTYLISSERPHRTAAIFRDAPAEAQVFSPRAAMLKRFDACVASDFAWATLPRGTRRVQMFHGVAGKWSQVYDRPDGSMLVFYRSSSGKRRVGSPECLRGIGLG